MKETKIKLEEGMKATVEIVNGELIVTTYEKEEKKYPKVMQTLSGGNDVLMISHSIGIGLRDRENCCISEYYESYDMECFKDYDGEITLKASDFVKVVEAYKKHA